MADIDIPVLGELDIVEIYVYYDRPILYSCKNVDRQLYLAVFADDDDENETWLYAEVSLRRLNRIRSGEIDLYNAFAKPENKSLFQVTVPYNPESKIKTETVQEVFSDMLPEEWQRLTVEGELLETFLGFDTLPPLSNGQEIARSKRREILDIRFNFDGISGTEAPIAPLVNILGKLQDLMDTIGRGLLNSNQIAQEGQIGTQFSLLQVGGGSFGVRLASKGLTDNEINRESHCGEAIRWLLEMLTYGLWDLEDGWQGRYRLYRRFDLAQDLATVTDCAAFLKSLNDSVEQMNLAWSSPNRDGVHEVSISKGEMRRAMRNHERFLRDYVPSGFTIKGKLTGVFHKAKRFEIETASATYTGYITDEAVGTVREARLGRTYTARIKLSIERSDINGEFTEPRYQLLRLEEYSREQRS